MGPLGMKSAHCAARRTRMIMLYESCLNSASRILVRAPTLKEEATIIAEYVGLDNRHARQFGGDELHPFKPPARAFASGIARSCCCPSRSPAATRRGR